MIYGMSDGQHSISVIQPLGVSTGQPVATGIGRVVVLEKGINHFVVPALFCPDVLLGHHHCRGAHDSSPLNPLLLPQHISRFSSDSQSLHGQRWQWKKSF
jgi:hypothetical protein